MKKILNLIKSNWGYILCLMAFFLGVYLVFSSVSNIVSSDSVSSAVSSGLEQAYFEGQRDAINGDVRIERNQDGNYIWRKSPWDNGRPPTFNPIFEQEQTLNIK